MSITLRKGMQNDDVAGDMHTGDHVDDAAGDIRAMRIMKMSGMARCTTGDVDGCLGETYGSYISSLQHSFKEERQKDLAAVLANATGDLMMVLSTRHEICMVDNFISNADKAAPDSTIVIVALDVESHDFCVGRRSTTKNAELRCLDFSSWISDLHSGPSGILTDGAAFSSCIWVKVVLAKPVLLAYAIQSSPHGLLMMDADIVLHGNLPRYVFGHVANATSLVVGMENNKGDSPNTGSIWADSGSIELVRQWISECRTAKKISSAGQGDQDCLDSLQEKSHDDKWLQMIPSHVLAEMAEKGGRLATHYNHVGDKIDRMRRDRVWKPSLDLCK
jgi:hypothetical protein